MHWHAMAALDYIIFPPNKDFRRLIKSLNTSAPAPHWAISTIQAYQIAAGIKNLSLKTQDHSHGY